MSAQPQESRFETILAYIEEAGLTPQQRQTLRDKLRRNRKPSAVGGAELRIIERMLKCRRKHHPATECRWKNQEQVKDRHGVPTVYDYPRCKERERIAAKLRAATKTCALCGHSGDVHDPDDGGRCYHVNMQGRPDCDCAGTKGATP